MFEDGGQLRDFVHVRDVARANVLALTAAEPMPGAFNVCTGTPRSVLEMAQALPQAGGPGAPAPEVVGGYRLGDVRHVFADPAHARERFGLHRTRELRRRAARAVGRVGVCVSAGAQLRGSVLVVDDEPTIAEVVCRYLRRAGYDASSAADGSEALVAVDGQRLDLVVLDLMLPGIDGLEVMRRLREGPQPVPAIILLTARGEESDRIIGLRLGADDYVVKPFSPGELVARVDAVLRRGATVRDPGPPLRVGALDVDVAGHRVLHEGQEIALTQREFDLLAFLARHPGHAFTREQLMDRVWRYTFYTDTSTVTVHIRRLRAKLEATADAGALIETVWGVGYRLVAQEGAA